MSLTAVFLAHWGGDYTGDTSVLEELLARRISEASQLWPAIGSDTGALLKFWASKVVQQKRVNLALETLCTADLYIVLGVLSDNANAVARFDVKLREEVSRVCRRMKMGVDAEEELAQDLREKLLLKGKTGIKGLEKYDGQGPLGRWMEIVAMRIQLNAMRTPARVTPVEQPILDTLVAKEKTIGQLHNDYFAEFTNAFAAAMQGLDTESKLVLRLAYLENVGLDEIGQQIGLSRASAHRRLVKARKQVAEDTEAKLKDTISVSTELLTEIQRLVSMSGMLKALSPKPGRSFHYGARATRSKSYS